MAHWQQQQWRSQWWSDGRASYSGRASHSGRAPESSADNWKEQDYGRSGRAPDRPDSSSGQAPDRPESFSRSREHTAAAPVRWRGQHERFSDEEVLRCTWPGPRNKTFPPKGDDLDFQWATEYASSVNLATPLHY